MNSASLCGLAGRYDNLIPPRFLAPILFKNSSSAANYQNNSIAQINRPSFRENKHKMLVFSHKNERFWACFRENWVCKFGHSCHSSSPLQMKLRHPREQVLNRCVNTQTIIRYRIRSSIQHTYELTYSSKKCFNQTINIG